MTSVDGVIILILVILGTLVTVVLTTDYRHYRLIKKKEPEVTPLEHIVTSDESLRKRLETNVCEFNRVVHSIPEEEVDQLYRLLREAESRIDSDDFVCANLLLNAHERMVRHFVNGGENPSGPGREDLSILTPGSRNGMNHRQRRCIKCGHPIMDDWRRCPYCAATSSNQPLTAKENCSSCGKPVKAGWRKCPYCAAPL